MGGKKERRGSTGNIEEILKRKRERMEQSGEVEDIFRKSRKTIRSPGKEKEGEGEIGDGAREDDRKGEKADSVRSSKE